MALKVLLLDHAAGIAAETEASRGVFIESD